MPRSKHGVLRTPLTALSLRLVLAVLERPDVGVDRRLDWRRGCHSPVRRHATLSGLVDGWQPGHRLIRRYAPHIRFDRVLFLMGDRLRTGIDGLHTHLSRVPSAPDRWRGTTRLS